MSSNLPVVEDDIFALGPDTSAPRQDSDEVVSAALDHPGRARRDRPARSIRDWVVAGALVVAMLASVLWALTERSHVQAQNDRQHAVTQVAGDIVAAMTTYDYTTMDATRSRVLSFATGTFARQYSDGFGALKDLAQQVKSRSNGTVKNVYVGEVGGHSASALVDVELVTSGASRVTRVGYYFTLSLLKVGGAWRVDDVVTLAYNPSTTGSSVTPPSGSAPATTAPAPPPTAPSTSGPSK